MGYLDQLAKQTFTEETEVITRGGVAFQPVPEIGLIEVRGDGLFLVRDPSRLTSLEWPWPAARKHKEILGEFKMQGDHLDIRAIQRGLLRRQALQVRRVEEAEPPWLGELALWHVAPTVPEVLSKVRSLRAAAPGCYYVEPSPFEFLWIAANELPLCDELVPFLIARTGRPLVELARWVVSHRPPAWVLRMIEIVPMPLTVREEIERIIDSVPRDHPEVRERGRWLVGKMLEHYPEVGERLIEQGIEKGIMPLVHQYERRLGRPLTVQEQHTLLDRLTRLGADRIGDVVLDLSAEALAAWLADPNAV